MSKAQNLCLKKELIKELGRLMSKNQIFYRQTKRKYSR